MEKHATSSECVTPWGTQSTHKYFDSYDKTHVKCCTWFPKDLFLVIKDCILPQAVDENSIGLNLGLTWFYACKIIGIQSCFNLNQ